jgi:hypothetical protein
MKSTEPEHIENRYPDGYSDSITFEEFVKELTGSTFEQVYKDYLIHGANYEQKSDLE